MARDKDFYNNKTIWITGASSGIGEAMTYLFNENGAKVIISARRAGELERVQNQCKYPKNITCQVLDVTDANAVESVARKLITAFHKIDIVVLNAGISQRSEVKDTLLSVDRRIMEVNYFGAIQVAKALTPSMIQHQLGHFVVISSVSGKTGVALRSAYCASKHALHGFFDALRAELYQHNIKVTLICPGYINTDISKNALAGDGQNHGVMDKMQAKGLTAKKAAQKILTATRKGKREVAFGGSEMMGIYLKRFAPGILARYLRNYRSS